MISRYPSRNSRLDSHQPGAARKHMKTPSSPGGRPFPFPQDAIIQAQKTETRDDCAKQDKDKNKNKKTKVKNNLMYSPGSGSRGNSRRRGINQVRWCRCDLPITSTLFTRDSTTAIDRVGTRGIQHLGVTISILQTCSHFVPVGLELGDLVATPGG